eukprot:2179630-Prymnesium_polylepis.2
MPALAATQPMMKASSTTWLHSTAIWSTVRDAASSVTPASESITTFQQTCTRCDGSTAVRWGGESAPQSECSVRLKKRSIWSGDAPNSARLTMLCGCCGRAFLFFFSPSSPSG